MSMIPWYVKIPAKIILSRLPIRYDLWRGLNLFRAGGMDNPQTAFDVFRMHNDAAGFSCRRGHTVLELGPGDSMLTALFARSFGAARTFLVDQSSLATTRMELFALAENLLARNDLPVPGVTGTNFIDALKLLNCSYMVDGLASLRAIPESSVDLVFSNAVLEHVSKRDFAATARELFRIMKPDGVASHWIDYRDHLQMGLNNLRFSEVVWESDFMTRSGFYTNRLPAFAIRALFEQAGFVVEECAATFWPGGLPTPQRVMSKPFRGMAPDELMVMTNWLLLRKPIAE